ncbi:MAG: DNA-formamidopyrimidine glycosylase family protein [Verrucomicrobiota bacterium]
MPELAEVEYYRKQWLPGLGETINQVHRHPKARVFRHCRPRLPFSQWLEGTTFGEAEAHGKHLLFRFDRPASFPIWLGIHLGMTGRLLCLEHPAHSPEKHDHLVLQLNKHALTFQDSRMFGWVRLDCGPDTPDWWSALPPSLFSESFADDAFRHRLDRRSNSRLKPLLLDQSLFPGIGNWMADEVLWRSRLSPQSRLAALSSAEKDSLLQQTTSVGRDALRIIGKTWDDPPADWLFPHRWKDGGHCPRPPCRAALQRAPIQGRTSCWCPVCQPATTTHSGQ